MTIETLLIRNPLKRSYGTQEASYSVERHCKRQFRTIVVNIRDNEFHLKVLSTRELLLVGGDRDIAARDT
jgi:hypothetical protein